MRHIRVTTEILARARDVWPYVAEIRRWPTWGPTVSAVESDAAVVGPGVRGCVKTVAGFWLPFEITSVCAGRSWNWRVAGIPATGHEVTEIDPGRCRLEFSVPWLAAPYAMVLRTGLARVKALAEGASPRS